MSVHNTEAEWLDCGVLGTMAGPEAAQKPVFKERVFQTLPEVQCEL